jgi:hypothetical protein
MQTIFSHLRRPRRAAAGVAILALAVFVASGCSNPFALKASYANTPFNFALYSLTGTGPANAPSALDIQSYSAVKVDGNFGFDIAFDLNAQGKIVVLPQKRVGTPLAGARVIALQHIAGAYDSVLEAPPGGWVLDSTLVVATGDVIGVKMTATSCLYQISQTLYAKVVIDSVKTGGLMYGRGVVDPNCGFKSFEAGVPSK